MNDDLKAKFAALSQQLAARRNGATFDKANVEAFKARIAAKRAEAQRLRPPRIPLNELTGDAYSDKIRIRALRDDTVNWRTLCVVVVGQYQQCDCCGYRAEVTSGFYLRQRHRNITGAIRLKRINHIPDELDIETIMEGVVLPRCIACITGEKRVDDLLAVAVRGGAPVITNQLSLELH